VLFWGVYPATSRRGAGSRLGELGSGARATPFLSASVRTEPDCDHPLSLRTDGHAGRVGGEGAIELRVTGALFVERNNRVDGMRGEQVVGGIVVMGGVAEEGGEH